MTLGQETNIHLFEEALGYTFENPALLENAFIHSSYLNECNDKNIEANERLEFLGDAVLELIVSDILFRSLPDEPEGALTKRRSQFVCEPSFGYIGHRLELGKYLFLGKGEEMAGGRTRNSLVADAFEAVCGAIYLDGGYEFLYSFIKHNLNEFVAKEKEAEVYFIDYKSKVQEKLHRLGHAFAYELISERGPAHDRSFVVALIVNDEEVAKGAGKSKKLAQQDAAKNAWIAWENEENHV